jgi:hypothetical protein
MICPGLSLGQVGKQSLAALIDTYNNNGSPLWQALRQDGVTGLLEIARMKGFKKRSDYAGRCHLCYEVRKFLRPHYPQYLAPGSCYAEQDRMGRESR